MEEPRDYFSESSTEKITNNFPFYIIEKWCKPICMMEKAFKKVLFEHIDESGDYRSDIRNDI